MKTALGTFIIAHGLVHGILAASPNPADPEPKPGAFFHLSRPEVVATPVRKVVKSMKGVV